MKTALYPIIVVGLLASGCAEMQQRQGMDNKTASVAGGAAVGCIAGALLAKVTGGDAATGCAVGAAIGGLAGFEKARKEEIAAAEQAKQDIVTALATLPKGQAAKTGEVQTVEISATDKKSREVKKYQAFDSVNVEIPLSAKGTPERDAAIGKLKTLAERVADERGSAEIIVAMTPADSKAQKVELATSTVKTKKGSDISVSKVADASVPKGVERITVRAGKLSNSEV